MVYSFGVGLSLKIEVRSYSSKRTIFLIFLIFVGKFWLRVRGGDYDEEVENL